MIKECKYIKFFADKSFIRRKSCALIS